MRAKEIVPLLGMLPSFGDIDRNPAFAVDIEIGPAMIAGDLGGMLVGGKRKSNFEAGRNALRAGHGDEQGMKVGAVAFLGVARIENIAVSPAGSGFVVAHGSEDVVVDGAGFVQRLR